jgi:glutathione S-transferase
MVDDNTQVALYESQDIIDYLFKTYGASGRTPRKFAQAPKFPVLGTLATFINGMRGLDAAVGNANRQAPAQLLQLWSFEGSPFSRPVRELLCELEIPYQLINVAKEQTSDIGPAGMRLHRGPYVPLPGGKRERLVSQVGKVQVPYLIDTNTGVSMFESADILHYLQQHYG